MHSIMKKATKKLIVLGQTIAEKYQLGHDVPSTTDNWMNALNDDSKEKSEDNSENNYGGKGEFELPPDHKAAMVIKGGSFSCANCKFVNAEKHECNNPYYIKWNGGDKKLPDAPLRNICSDWFSPKK